MLGECSLLVSDSGHSGMLIARNGPRAPYRSQHHPGASNRQALPPSSCLSEFPHLPNPPAVPVRSPVCVKALARSPPCYVGSTMRLRQVAEGRANAYNYVALTNLSVARSRASLSIATAACFAVTLIMLVRAFRPAEATGQHAVLKAADGSDDGPIPSIVHYACIKEDASSVLHFPFASFLAVFAAVVYLKPARI